MQLLQPQKPSRSFWPARLYERIIVCVILFILVWYTSWAAAKLYICARDIIIEHNARLVLEMNQ